MITLFSCPKPFISHTAVIQKNAVKSWSLLEPRPEIILLGEEEGVSKACAEFGLLHVEKVETNENGTPLISSIFEQAISHSSQPFLCYINSDIILLGDFIKSIRFISEKIENSYLLIGCRWDVNITKQLEFGESWESDLRRLVKEKGVLREPVFIDYFIFPKGILKKIPPFLLGRPRWDNWFVWNAIEMNIPVIDITRMNMIIHQSHDYSHLGQAGYKQLMNPEWEANEKLLGKWWPRYYYTIWDSDFVLKDSRIKKNSFMKKFDSKLDRMTWLIAIALKKWLPFTYPIILLCNGCYKIFLFIRGQFYKRV